MPRIRVSLTLVCATPPSIGAGGVGGTVADKVVVRNGSGQFIVPASQVKGKLRHACEQLLRAYDVPLCRPPVPENMCPQLRGMPEETWQSLPVDAEGNRRCLLCAVFGSPAYPSRLRFHDLVAVPSDLPRESLRTMVSLNRQRRAAQEKRLFLVETAPPLEGLEFASQEAITGHVDEEAHLHLLLAGLNLLHNWGGGSSRGLGWAATQAEAWMEGLVTLQREEVARLCRSSR